VAGSADSAYLEKPHRICLFPSDTGAFTQGLLFHEGFLYKSTGLYGESTLRRIDLDTGRVLAMRSLPYQYFGEGLALWRDRLIQLTWKNRTGFVYRLGDLSPLRTFHYEGEGWGLTNDDRHLILSNGSSELRFLDPETFAVVRRIQVHDGQRPVDQLNELEYIDGEVWANVWMTDRIVRIDPTDGRVTGWIDLSGLLPEQARTARTAELNGIAYDAGGKRIFVTGKLWPKIFQIELISSP
jgi:glutaminyl-peptide cyclotransferase